MPGRGAVRTARTSQNAWKDALTWTNLGEHGVSRSVPEALEAGHLLQPPPLLQLASPMELQERRRQRVYELMTIVGTRKPKKSHFGGLSIGCPFGGRCLPGGWESRGSW